MSNRGKDGACLIDQPPASVNFDAGTALGIPTAREPDFAHAKAGRLVLCEEAREGNLFVRNRLRVQPLVRATQADVMNGFDAAPDDHGRGFAVDVAAGTQGLPPLFQKRNPTHVEAEGPRMPKKSLLGYPSRQVYAPRVIRRYDVTPFLRPPGRSIHAVGNLP